VIPRIFALIAMTTSFNGARTRLNVDHLYFKSFDECLMIPIGQSPLSIVKVLIGVMRGILSPVAFLAVADAISVAIHIEPLFLVGLLLTCLTFAFLGILAALWAKSHEYIATFGSLILMPMTSWEERSSPYLRCLQG
jgi:ABC-2 type transport system permease protein